MAQPVQFKERFVFKIHCAFDLIRESAICDQHLHFAAGGDPDAKHRALQLHPACRELHPLLFLWIIFTCGSALALISGQPGYVTQFGVVYDNGIKLEQAYDRKHLPPIWMAENCILELKIRATGEDDPKKQEP